LPRIVSLEWQVRKRAFSGPDCPRQADAGQVAPKAILYRRRPSVFGLSYVPL